MYIFKAFIGFSFPFYRKTLMLGPVGVAKIVQLNNFVFIITKNNNVLILSPVGVSKTVHINSVKKVQLKMLVFSVQLMPLWAEAQISSNIGEFFSNLHLLVFLFLVLRILHDNDCL